MGARESTKNNAYISNTLITSRMFTSFDSFLLRPLKTLFPVFLNTVRVSLMCCMSLTYHPYMAKDFYLCCMRLAKRILIENLYVLLYFAIQTTCSLNLSTALT